MEDGSRLTAEKLRKTLEENGILLIPGNSSRYVNVNILLFYFNKSDSFNYLCGLMWFQDQNGYTPSDNYKWCALHIVLFSSKNIQISQLPTF